MATTKTRESAINAMSIEPAKAADEHSNKVSTSNANRKNCHRELMRADKVPVSISPLYAPEFSDNMCVTINGYSVYVPCDGQTYMISEPFANIIFERIARVDEKARTQDKMANVQSNCESFAGANAFIARA